MKMLPRGQAELSLPGSSPGRADVEGWNVVALETVVLPPLSEGLVIGKIPRNNGVDLPREVLIEPLELGMLEHILLEWQAEF
jgi:hypothetical protein